MADEVPIKITERAKNIAAEARTKLIHVEMSDVITEEARSVVTEEAKNISAEARTKLIHEEMSDVITEEARSVVTEEARSVITGKAKSVITGKAKSVVIGKAKSVVIGKAKSVVIGKARSVVTGEACAVVTGEACAVVTEESSAVVTEKSSNNTSEELQQEPRRSRQLFIGNLNYRSTHMSLKTHFEQWGEVVSCNVARHPKTKESRGYGFVTYKRTHMVNDAEAARPHEIDGRVVVVKRVISKELQQEEERFLKLFIGNLNCQTTEETLISYFGQWGEVVTCNVVRNHNTGESRGFGFITYKTAHMVDAVEAAGPHKIDSKEIDIRHILEREDLSSLSSRAMVQTLFVTKLKGNVKEQDLREYFGKYGEITYVQLPTHTSTGKNRGFAFVRFNDYGPVEKILMSGSHFLKGEMIQVRRSLPKEVQEYVKLFQKWSTGKLWNS